MCAEKHMEKVKEENMNAVIGKRGQLGMPILQMELEVRSFKFKHHVALINMPFHIAFLRREPVSVLFSVFPREILLCLYYCFNSKHQQDGFTIVQVKNASNYIPPHRSLALLITRSTIRTIFLSGFCK